ncbi:MAG: hypothetical protein IJ364_04300 [Oscillospiraceae bacterium]|nr:hypothetical protein [Oscillospiraceae bacterium]
MGNVFIAAAAAIVCTILILLFREILLLPVKTGKNTSQIIFLQVFGSEPLLEKNLQSLIWLGENGIIRGSIVIHGCGLDEETLFIAKSYEQEYRGITFIQDGELNQWIRNLNY